MIFITIGNVTIRKNTINSITLEESSSRSSHQNYIEIITSDGKRLEADFNSKEEAQKAYDKAKKELEGTKDKNYPDTLNK